MSRLNQLYKDYMSRMGDGNLKFLAQCVISRYKVGDLVQARHSDVTRRAIGIVTAITNDKIDVRWADIGTSIYEYNQDWDLISGWQKVKEEK